MKERTEQLEKLKQQYPKLEFEINCVINEIQHEKLTTWRLPRTNENY